MMNGSLTNMCYHLELEQAGSQLGHSQIIQKLIFAITTQTKGN